MRWLPDTPQVPTLNHGGRIALPPLVVVHYTAGRSAANTIRRFKDPASRVSAHFVIAEDGAVTQMVPCDRRAWHAGESRLEMPSGEILRGINNHSIGIELDYDGPLKAPTEGRRLRKAEDMLHRPPLYWPSYDSRQVDALVALVVNLRDRGWLAKPAYLTGHEDIAPVRKRDPGPTFPWADVCERTGMQRLTPPKP